MRMMQEEEKGERSTEAEADVEEGGARGQEIRGQENLLSPPTSPVILTGDDGDDES